jgi:hypothetical protein
MIEITGNNLIKDFIFIIDPRSLSSLTTPLHDTFANLDYLRKSSDIGIELVWPKYISENNLYENSVFTEVFKVISKAPSSDFQLHETVENKILKDSNELSEIGQELSLLALSESMTADGIVTDSEFLIKNQYALYQYHRIRIVPVNEFQDMICVISVGNSVFWSKAYARDIGFDTFYIITNWKATKLFEWWSKLVEAGQVAEKELKDNLRSALLNRFPYILYSRDMVRFYQLQRDYYARRRRFPMHGLSIGFFINTFYLMLWGMLDHLTILAKYAKKMDVPERECGIRSKKFLKELRKVENDLYNFVKKQEMDEWIGIMADLRHKAAHNIIPIPSVLLFETDDSKKTDSEIIEILMKEKPDFYRLFDAKAIETLQPAWIDNWRMKKMEIGAPGMIVVSKPNGTSYMRDPVISVDYDLSQLIDVMDTFLIKLFN